MRSRSFFMHPTTSQSKRFTMRLPIVTIGITLSMLALYLIAGAMPEQFIWQHGLGLEIWRWISAHFVHINVDHLIWNLVAFGILASIIEQTSRKVLGLALAFGIIGVNIYLATFFSLNAYAGLSGTLNALLFIALYFLYQQPGYKLASIITLILSVAKIIVEFSFGLSLFSTLPWPSVPQAHFAGLISGGLLAAALELRKKRLLESDLVSFNDLPVKINHSK